jgi:hypothetical protein
MYQVQFISSSIVAFSSTDRAMCQHFIECNNFSDDVPMIDPDTGEIVPEQWVKGDCLNLFKLVKVKE